MAISEILVTFVPPDTAAPTVEITFPTEQQEFATSESTVNLAGTAADERSLKRVTWLNNRGGGSDTSGGSDWHANDIALQPGVNVITVTAEDTAGNTTTDTLSVTYSPIGADPLRPVLSIQTPSNAAFTILDNHLGFAGSANGSSAVTEVVAQVNGGPWLGAVGTARWTEDMPLTPGKNVIHFKRSTPRVGNRCQWSES